MNVCQPNVLGVQAHVKHIVLAEYSWSFINQLFQESPGFEAYSYTNIITEIELNIRWSTDSDSETLNLYKSSKC